MPQITFTIDGKKVTCEKGTMILQAGLDAGIFIPHYCYHPALSVAGNCRMCMVEIVPKPPPGAPPGWKPPPQKPAIACATEAVEGMVVKSATSDLARAARQGVLEFLLLNHPLDCPVCDQAGECDLQDFSFEHGQATSRFEEEKEHKHLKDLGPEVRLYGNRCINCTRCVRFSQEVSGGGEICQVNRGDRTIVDIFPGKAWDNPLSGNVVDICPVGALVSRDFLHKARVWQLDATPSVCPHCSTGCSIEIHTRDEEIQRLKPRLNPKVNGFWMCDAGRLGYKYVADPARLKRIERRAAAKPEGGGDRPPGAGELSEEREPLTFQAAVALLAGELAKAGDRSFALASAWMTNEELFLLTRLFPKERIALHGREPWKEQRFYPRFGESLRNPSLPGQHDRQKLREDGASFVIEADRNPNRRGADRILGAEACSEGRRHAFFEACERGEVATALVFSGMPDHRPPADLLGALDKVPFVALCDILAGPLAARAHLILPVATVAEKEGTFTGGGGTTQRFLPSRPPPGQARSELEILHALALRAGKALGAFSPAETFAELTAAVSDFADLTFATALVRSPKWSPHFLARAAAAPGAPLFGEAAAAPLEKAAKA